MKKILIIDDEKYRHQWFEKHLAELGCDIRLAWDADQALEQMRATEFDLVFFDHDLGAGFNGSQLAREVLENPKQYRVPKCVWVHSVNWHGTQNIVSKFTNAKVRVHVDDFSNITLSYRDFVCAVQDLLGIGEQP